MSVSSYRRSWATPAPLDRASLWAGEAGLREAGAVVARCVPALSRLSAVDVPVQGWSGAAAETFAVRAARASGRLAEVADVASLLAGVLAGFRVDSERIIARWSAADDLALTTQARIEELDAQGLIEHPELDRVNEDSLRTIEICRRDHAEVVHRTAQRVVALRELITNHGQDAEDVASTFTATLWTKGVVEPAQVTWTYTGDVVVNPARWWSAVSALPQQAGQGLWQAVSNPADTIGALFDRDVWARHQTGEGLADAVLTFVPRPRWLALSRDRGPRLFSENLARASAPLPDVQTVDEMLADGVNLSRHEHRLLGHTLRRHVNVRPEYLMDRLTHGTLLDDGRRGRRPVVASAFSDQRTAEASVTTLIRRHESAVRDFTVQAVAGETLLIADWTDLPVGTVVAPSRGGFSLSEADAVSVVLSMGPTGPYVATAFCGSSRVMAARVVRNAHLLKEYP